MKFTIVLLIVTCFIRQKFTIEATRISMLYKNTAAIEYFTTVLSNHPLFEKQFCPEYPENHFMIIGNRSSNLSGIIVCGLHAREVISPQICLSWMTSLRKQPKILQKMHFKVFYLANSQHDKVLTIGNECIRKNNNKVDLNRNFPTQFNFYKVNKQSAIYPGQQPFSEPFTNCLQQQIKRQKPDFFMDIHSGELAFYYQEGINNQNQINIIKQMTQKYLTEKIKITTLNKDHQSINGHIFADVKVRYKIKYSILAEVYASNIETDNCFILFNPTIQQNLINAKTNWTKIISSIVQNIIQLQQ